MVTATIMVGAEVAATTMVGDTIAITGDLNSLRPKEAASSRLHRPHCRSSDASLQRDEIDLGAGRRGSLVVVIFLSFAS